MNEALDSAVLFVHPPIEKRQNTKNKPNDGSLRAPRTLRSAFSDMEKHDELDTMIVNTTNAWYDAKHPVQTIDEIRMINSLAIEECPFCHRRHFHRDGFNKSGIQMYQCNGCKRKFNPLTDTIFDSHKIPISQWIEFLIHPFQLQSIKVSAVDNANANSSGRYWAFKVFKALKHYQDDLIVQGDFYTDETYIPVMPHDMIYKDGKKLRGLSRNVHCIFTAADSENAVLIANGFGKPSIKKAREALLPHVAKGSRMIDDGERSHSVLVTELNVERTIHPTKMTKGLPNEKNPMDPINEVHRTFKRFMKNHGGFKRSRIQDWCNLFSFIWNHHGDLPRMVRDMLQLLVSTHGVVRYRSVMAKNPDEHEIR